MASDSGSGDAWTHVHTARSPSEAAFLAAALNEAGIPAQAQGEALSALAGAGFPGPIFSVRVPKSYLERAEALLRDRQALALAAQDDSIAPADASEQEAALREVFARDTALAIPDPRRPSDPLLADMVQLRDQPKGQRREALEPYLRDWIARGEDPLAAAKYLAAAGLSLEEAAELERYVRARLEPEMRALGRARMAAGLALGGVAVLLAYVQALPIWGLLCAGFACAAVVVFFDGLRVLRRLSPPAA